ncbi:MAG TPA: molecular chaperone SurA, partial [Balneolaceae bacterium]|nr:molecular chaperone SurA [Balneolaceae bacterium]
MKKLFFSLILIITAFSNATLKAQQTKPADQIVAIVNDRIILKSEIDN